MLPLIATALEQTTFNWLWEIKPRLVFSLNPIQTSRVDVLHDVNRKKEQDKAINAMQNNLRSKVFIIKCGSSREIVMIVSSR